VALAILLAVAYGAIGRRLDRGRYLLWDNGWEWANVRWGLPGHRPDQLTGSAVWGVCSRGVVEGFEGLTRSVVVGVGADAVVVW
jgi:hypothetical protein